MSIYFHKDLDKSRELMFAYTILPKNGGEEFIFKQGNKSPRGDVMHRLFGLETQARGRRCVEIFLEAETTEDPDLF